jgi:hypothetical protein
LVRLLAELDDGDTVMVTRLDRLARSTRDLLNTLAAIGAAGISRRYGSVVGVLAAIGLGAAVGTAAAFGLLLVFR